MANVFICHSTSSYDVHFATTLCAYLMKQGIDSRLSSEKAPQGISERDFLGDIINNTDYFLILVSGNTTGKHSSQQKIINLALEIKQDSLFSIPILIDNNCKSKYDSTVDDQWIDLSQPYEDSLNRLLQVIREAKWPQRIRAPRRASSLCNKLIALLTLLFIFGSPMFYAYSRAKTLTTLSFKKSAALLPAKADLPRKPERMTILVANFPNLDGLPDRREADRLQITEHLLGELNSKFSNSPMVKIEWLNSAFTDRSNGSYQARQEGGAKGAQIVIWGWYTTTTTHAFLNSGFEILGDSSDPPICHLDASPVSSARLVAYEPTQRLNATPELNSVLIYKSISDPISYLTYSTLGIYHYQLGDWGNSIKNLNLAIQMEPKSKGIAPEPDSSTLLLFRADAFYQSGDLAASLEDFSAANRTRQSSFANYGIGRIYARLGKPDKAIESFTKSITLNPGFSYAYLARGLALELRGDKSQFLQDFYQAINFSGDEFIPEEVDKLRSLHGSSVVSWCKQESERGSGDPLKRYACANILLHSDMRDLAVSEYEAIKKRWPGLGLAYYKLGALYLVNDRTDKLSDAIANFRKSISLGPFIPCANTLLSTAYIAQQNNQAAIETINRAIEATPRDFGLYCFRSWIHYKNGEDSAALDDSEDAISLAPNEACGFSMHGRVTLRQGNARLAIRDFSKAISRAPDIDIPAYLGRGEAYTEVFRLFNAAKDYFAVLLLRERNEENHIGRMTIITEGDPKEARKGVRRIATLWFLISLGFSSLILLALEWSRIISTRNSRPLLTRTTRVAAEFYMAAPSGLAHKNAANKIVTPRDVFFCHVPEDRRSVVEPLVKAFKKKGYTVWYREAEIRWGDVISSRISEGLKISHFVIVVLSNAFLDRKEPEDELFIALHLESSAGEVRVLPLLVGDDREKYEIIDNYPLLSAKKWLDWDGNVSTVIETFQARL